MSFQFGISGIFLGFLTGVIWLLLALSGFITEFFGLLGIGGVLANILNILVALIGFLAFVLFGLYLFKKAWHYCK
ncbi:fluoride ion exporter CrcB/FEX [Lysinibacillus composti]|uniref:ABC transporter n=1 Tax=Lysinibacillus composti TaxID=720633 RepID=A0A3N9UFD8_9BACI|nr:ABC transporter [Lysinibacillus composti]MBM7608551.1 fluoride ion exporter CrcB/FEX [Lysinibacillus composti]RQW74835.1 ABC transporter [Lysinibacillus composti]